MKSQVILLKFKENLKKKLPSGANLASTLANDLCIGVEAAYRRLRGEVEFSLTELITLAEKYSLSLDYILGLSDPQFMTMQMMNLNLLDPSDSDMEVLEATLKSVENSRYDNNSKVSFVSSSLPQIFIYKFPNLARFKTYKWMYTTQSTEARIVYKDMHIDEQTERMILRMGNNLKSIKFTEYVLDDSVLSYAISDLVYFHQLELMEPGEIKAVRDDLELFLDELEMCCVRGCYDNGNKVDIYRSDTLFDTTFGIVQIGKFQLSLIRSLVSNTIFSINPQIFEKAEEWIEIRKRQSSLISGAGEIQRRNYFAHQRKLLEKVNPLCQ